MSKLKSHKTVEEIAKKDVPTGLPYKIVNLSDLQINVFSNNIQNHFFIHTSMLRDNRMHRFMH